MRGGRDARRNAEEDADQRRDGGELERRGKDAGDVLGDGAGGQERFAEIAGEHVADIDRELRRRAACRGRAPAAPLRTAPGWRARPTTASAGSIGMMRPMKKVTKSSPKKVMSRLSAVCEMRQAAPGKPMPPPSQERRGAARGGGCFLRRSAPAPRYSSSALRRPRRPLRAGADGLRTATSSPSSNRRSSRPPPVEKPFTVLPMPTCSVSWNMHDDRRDLLVDALHLLDTSAARFVGVLLDHGGVAPSPWSRRPA